MRCPKPTRGRITYTPRPETTPEAERSALAAVYAFVLDRHANEETACPGGPNGDAKELEGGGCAK